MFVSFIIVFLSEVIDSLTRGLEEKLNPAFLILEINSSRYAYNMSLAEVNFFVVKALLSLPPVQDAADGGSGGGNVMAALKQVLAHLDPVLNNYIRGDEAQRHCLKAIEECCGQNENLKMRIAQIVHYLYDKDTLSDDAILSWHAEVVAAAESNWIVVSLKKLIDWLQESSDDDDDESD